MRIALVDDEHDQLDALAFLIKQQLAAQDRPAPAIEAFPSAAALLDAWRPGAFDLVVLDIFMDGTSGVDCARALRERDANVALAFCTTSNDFASESYEVDARYYLRKPITPEGVSALLARVGTGLDRRRGGVVLLPDGLRLSLEQLVYTNYHNHTVTIHLRGSEPHALRASQTVIRDLLLGHPGLCEINKGCIVNLDAVRGLGPSGCTMVNGDQLPVSRRRYREVKEAYARWRLAKLDEEVPLR